MTAALRFADAAALAEYPVEIADDKVALLRYALPDAHGIGIPTGTTQGSVCDYAAACVHGEPWRLTWLTLIVAQSKGKAA